MTFYSTRHEKLKELNICETKHCEIKVCELELEKSKVCGKTANEQIFMAFTYLSMDFKSFN